MSKDCTYNCQHKVKHLTIANGTKLLKLASYKGAVELVLQSCIIDSLLFAFYVLKQCCSAKFNKAALKSASEMSAMTTTLLQAVSLCVSWWQNGVYIIVLFAGIQCFVFDRFELNVKLSLFWTKYGFILNAIPAMYKCNVNNQGP